MVEVNISSLPKYNYFKHVRDIRVQINTMWLFYVKNIKSAKDVMFLLIIQIKSKTPSIWVFNMHLKYLLVL